MIVANTFAWSGWHFFCAGADASYVQYTPLPLAAPHASAWLVGLKFTIAQAVMDAATGAISPCKAAWFLGPQPDAWAIHPHAGLREHDPESFSRAHSAAAMTIEHVSRRYTIQRNNAGHPIHMYQHGRHWHTTPKVLRPTPRDLYMPCRRSLHGQPYPHASTETT